MNSWCIRFTLLFSHCSIRSLQKQSGYQIVLCSLSPVASFHALPFLKVILLSDLDADPVFQASAASSHDLTTTAQAMIVNAKLYASAAVIFVDHRVEDELAYMHRVGCIDMCARCRYRPSYSLLLWDSWHKTKGFNLPRATHLLSLLLSSVLSPCPVQCLQSPCGCRHMKHCN